VVSLAIFIILPLLLSETIRADHSLTILSPYLVELHVTVISTFDIITNLAICKLKLSTILNMLSVTADTLLTFWLSS